MTVAKVTEVIASSKVSFEDAIKNAVTRAGKTLKNISGVWVKDQNAVVKNGDIVEFRVTCKLTFVLED